jgi:hypothetical protein
MATIQDLIEQSRIVNEAKKGMKKEKIENIKSLFSSKPLTSSVSTPTKKLDKSISKFARKLINVAAPKGSIVSKLTSTAKKKSSGKGRGRPRQTFKTRVLPISGKVVKVPTSIYNKMVSQEKSALRLAQAQRQAEYQLRQSQAEQIAMQQDPRFQAQSQFLVEPDQQHEMNVALAQQQLEMQQLQDEQMQPQQQQPSVTRRIVSGISNLGNGISRLSGLGQQQSYDQFGRQIIQQIPLQRYNPQQRVLVREPRVTAISEKASLLNVGNQFNRNQLTRRRI